MTSPASGRRLKAPWSVRDNGSAFIVSTEDGIPLTYIYYLKTDAPAVGAVQLTWDEARRVAANIAKLPELLAGQPKGGV